MRDQVIIRMFSNMVKQVGGVEAAASLIEARWGGYNPANVTKMSKGKATVGVEAIQALEDALGVYTITNYLHSRVSDAGADPRPENIKFILQSLAVDGNETTAHLITKIIRAFSPHSENPEDLTPCERADLIGDVTQWVDQGQDLLKVLKKVEGGDV